MKLSLGNPHRLFSRLQAFRRGQEKQGVQGLEARDWRERIEGVRKRLEMGLPGLEKNFLCLGEGLEKVDGCSRRLVEHSEKLLRVASGGEEGANLLSEALEVLKGPLAYIDYCLEQQHRLFELLAECETQTNHMLGVRTRMQEAIAPLTFMAILFKIESAYLGVDLRETFLTVTLEVERLHRLVNETFADNAKQLTLAHETLRTVRLRLEADFKEQAAQIATKRSTIDKAIQQLDRQLNQATDRDSQLHRHDQALAVETAKVVMGLQFQDIVKQKCDHVLEALGTGRGARPSNEVLTLQARQLQSVEEDLSLGSATIETGLGRIADLTEQLNHSSVSLENFESMTASVDGMVQLLLETFIDVHGIIRMVSQLTDEGYVAVQPANGIARNLTSAIGELSINMQLIALNAQIRSVQSGQGTGLETLAARTAEISGDITGISATITEELEKLHQGIDEMLKLFGTFRERGKEELAAMEAARHKTENRLHSLRDKALTAVQEIGSDVDAMHEAIAEVKGALAEMPGFSAGVKEACGLLQPFIQLDGQGVDLELLNQKRDTYTMASEREVHDRLVEVALGYEEAPEARVHATRQTGVTANNKNPKPKENIALGENVELF